MTEVNENSWPPDGLFSSNTDKQCHEQPGLFSLFGLQAPAMRYYLTPPLNKERFRIYICFSIFKTILPACIIITANGSKRSILRPTTTEQHSCLVKNLHWIPGRFYMYFRSLALIFLTSYITILLVL